jgi:cytochrome bd ubiquinol oxidase subunit II
LNALYTINYFIFSIFLTLFMVELGLAVISLFYYDKYKDQIKHAINPLWSVTGTFAIFYLINFEVSYPKLVGIVGTAYVLPLLLAAIFIILRNIFIVFSEYIGENKSERNFRVAYSLSTLIAAILLIAVLTSGISGVGISTSTSSINSSFLLNPFSIIMLIALLLFSIFLASGIIKPSKQFKIGIASSLVGFALGLFAVYIYLPNLHLGTQIYATIAVSIVMLAISALLQFKKTKYFAIFNILFVLVLINLLGIANYPYVFGNVNSTGYLASSTIANASILITTIGGAIVSVSLALFIYINYIKKD